MGLSSPWDNAFIEPKQKEQSSVMVKINHEQNTNIITDINPMVLGAYWYNTYTEPPQKEQYTMMFIN